MAISLDSLYDRAYKASSSFSTTYRDAGNKSLGALAQQVLPFTESGQPATSVTNRGNNGNITGDFPQGYPSSFGYPNQHRLTDWSMAAVAPFSSSWAVWGSGAVNYKTYAMTYKFVPWGWQGNGSQNILQQKECLMKLTDVVNFDSVNITGSQPAEKSGSFGLPFFSGSQAVIGGNDGNPGGVLSCLGNNRSFFWHYGFMQNNLNIPPGSGSYKIPRNVQDPLESIVVMFWVKVPAFPEGTTAIWCNSMPQSTIGNEDWDPFTGYMCEVTSNGTLIFSRGDGGGTSTFDYRSFNTTWQLNNNQWNFVVVRLSSASNSVGTTSNYAWVYKDGGRGYTWNNGLSYQSGLGGAVKYVNNNSGKTTGMVISPGNNSRYFSGSVGHMYWFWEDTATGTKISFDKFEQAVYITDSGSMYTNP